MQSEINASIRESIETKNKLLSLTTSIEDASKMLVDALKHGNKIIIGGNGGSATQASHFVAELTGRFHKDRIPLAGIALTTDIAAITAIGNDYGFEKIFERQLDALANKGDVFIGLSTSGNSENIIRAIEKAKQKGVKTIALLGKDGGKMKGICDIEIIVPSDNTARIQESHIMILHIFCEQIDKVYVR